MTELQKIAAAAFLHDIGKFSQRAEFSSEHLRNPELVRLFLPDRSGKPTHWHALHTYAFLATLGVPDNLAALAASHHKSGARPEEEVLAEADRLSATERDTAEEAGADGNHQSVRLKPVFLRLKGGEAGEGWSYPLVPLACDETILPVQGAIAREDGYRGLLEGFRKDYETLLKDEEDFGRWFTGLRHLCRKYLWAVPSVVFRSVPDISLYNHSRTAAAIAAVLWRNRQTGGKSFALVSVDLSGIQEFIYRISRERHYAVRLRGRSLMVNLAGQLTARYLLDRLGLPETNLLYCGGGTLQILAHDIPDAEWAETETTVQRAFFERFGGVLAPVCGVLKFDAEDLCDYGGLMERARLHLNERKLRKFDRILPDLFRPGETRLYAAPDVCPSCGAEASDGHETCRLCRASVLLGEGLVKKEWLVLSSSEKADFVMRFGDRTYGAGFWSVSDEGTWMPEGAELLRVNRTDFVDPSLPERVRRRNAFGFIFLGSEVPTHAEEGRLLSFEEIAKKARGVDRLAAYKADIDDMGRILSEGFPEDLRSMSRILDLSFLTDLFFSGYVNHLVSSEFGGTVYLVYSGGDDLLAVGAWDAMVRFVERFQEAFRRFVCHQPPMHASGGVALFRPKTPLYDVIDEVKEREHAAKSWRPNKDATFLFGQAVANHGGVWDLPRLLAFGESLRELAGGDEGHRVVSRSLLNRLLALAERFRPGERNEDPRWMPLVAYALNRNIKERVDGERKELKDRLKSAMPFIRIPVTYALYSLREQRGTSKGGA